MTAQVENEPLRLDAEPKVTGGARYSGDIRLPDEVHGALVLSSIASGWVDTIDATAAERVEGFHSIITHVNAPRVSAGDGVYATWLQDASIVHAGQPIALVLAKTPRAARDAARLVSVRYDPRPSLPRLSDARARPYEPSDVQGGPATSRRGDTAAGRKFAHALIEATYTTATNVHSPMEPHIVLAQWLDGHLIVHTSTSGIFAARRVLATAMRVPEARVRVLMRFQGGGFGSKGSAWWPTLILAASVARDCGRPLRLELTREDMFTVVGRRAPTVQRVALGADPDGRLTYIEHEAIQETSTFMDYSDPTCFPSRSVYSCENVTTRHLLVRSNIPRPNAMRAPGEGPGSFALESALDELAEALRLDPVELRLRNVALSDEHHDRAWSSNGLRECLVRGARAFGWTPTAPGQAPQREGHWLIGHGVAAAYYPVFQSQAAARIRIDARGRVALYCGNQDIGTGARTVMAQAAARELGMAPEEVIVHYGDTELPEAPMAAGSMGTASVIPAVERAARAVRAEVLRAATANERSPLYGLARTISWTSPRQIIAGEGVLTTSVEELAHLLEVSGWEATAASAPPATPPSSSSAFGACFAEVRVDPELGCLRVTRLTGACAAGRILNDKLARSQYLGGMVAGLGMALHERMVEDAATGLPINGGLIGYHLPVNADVPETQVVLVEEHDANEATHGIKGIGLMAAVGVAAAIANATYQAIGRRFRDLPITPDRLAL